MCHRKAQKIKEMICSAHLVRFFVQCHSSEEDSEYDLGTVPVLPGGVQLYYTIFGKQFPPSLLQCLTRARVCNFMLHTAEYIDDTGRRHMP